VSPSGLVVVDKPGGMTSHDVVARVRRALGTRKVGHAGTLDPMATGVLVLGVGRATRLLGHLALRDKQYTATVRLGATTVTDDVEGEVIEAAPADAVQALDDTDIAAALHRLVGTIQQRPSAVSAIKVEGRRAYDRVRSGEDVVLAPRTVVVSRIDVTDMRWGPGAVDVDIEVECSTGTYIRAIARDAGADLGVGGHLSALRRTRVGPFDVESAIGLDQLAQAGEAALVPMPEVAVRCFPTWRVDADESDAVAHGRRIPWTGPAGPTGPEAPVAIVGPDGAFLALCVDDDGLARYLAVLA
jgi:tRNA pseudouridine55 synthase